MAEYFVKLDAAAEAQGPLTLAELKTFAQTGRITGQTLHFFDDEIGWQPIATNTALSNELFGAPGSAKRRLGLRHDTAPAFGSSPKAVITVESMVNPESKASVVKPIGKVLSLLIPLFLGLFYGVQGALLVWRDRATLLALVSGPRQELYFVSQGIALGLILMILGISFLARAQRFYSFGRVMAFITMGYLGVMAWSHLYEGFTQSGWILLTSGICFGLGAYCLTVSRGVWFFCCATIVAFGGVLALGLACL